MKKPTAAAPKRKRGRPRKFARPSQVVALTLPDDVVRGLGRVHPDLAWAIVTMFEGRSPTGLDVPAADVELVTVGERRSLIVVSRKAYSHLPGVHIIPLDGTRAFLALEQGRGVADLQLAVIDRLAEKSVGSRERQALRSLQAQLHKWRHSHTLRFHTHAIIVAERAPFGNGRPRRKSR